MIRPGDPLPELDLRPPQPGPEAEEPEPTRCATCNRDSADLDDGNCARCVENGWCTECCRAFAHPDHKFRTKHGDRLCFSCLCDVKTEAGERANDAAKDDRRSA